MPLLKVDGIRKILWAVLYGLEVTILTKIQQNELRAYDFNLLRINQGFPKSTASNKYTFLKDQNFQKTYSKSRLEHSH